MQNLHPPGGMAAYLVFRDRMTEPPRHTFADKDFPGLVKQHQSLVFSLAYHFLRDAALAEELAQEVFMQLHRDLRSLESEQHVEYWLRRVTTHRAIDYGRRQQRERRLIPLESAPELSTPPRTGDPLLSESLRKLVAALPERLRAIVILRFQEDLDPTEIAKILDMPVNTVKSRLHRSLEFLRRKLERTQTASVHAVRQGSEAQL